MNTAFAGCCSFSCPLTCFQLFARRPVWKNCEIWSTKISRASSILGQPLAQLEVLREWGSVGEGSKAFIWRYFVPDIAFSLTRILQRSTKFFLWAGYADTVPLQTCWPWYYYASLGFWLPVSCFANLHGDKLLALLPCTVSSLAPQTRPRIALWIPKVFVLG